MSNDIEKAVSNFKSSVKEMTHEDSLLHFEEQKAAYETEYTSFINAYEEDRLCSQ